jgi:hypothetical protein
MIVKDEVATLERCLCSVQGLTAEQVGWTPARPMEPRILLDPWAQG